MMRRTQLLIGSMALVGALWGALLLISGLGLQAAEAQTATTPSSGTVTAWGDNEFGQSSVPVGLSGVTAIDAGSWHSLALKGDGTVAAWDDNIFGVKPPAGLSGVTAIDAGGSHNLALKGDGTVVAWGNNEQGQTDVPAGLSGVTAISAGDKHSLALVVDNTPPTLSVSHSPDGTNGWNKTSPVTLNVSASDSGSSLAGAPTCTDGTSSLTLTAGSTAGSWTAGVSGDGTHTISCSVSDMAGNPSGPKTDTVKIDTSAPSTSCSVTPSKLNPSANNHKLVNITASVQVTDSAGGSGVGGFQLISVTSNQAQSGLAKDDVPNDIQGWDIGTPDLTGQLRTERYGGARTYTLTYRGSDVAGNTKDCSATVTVPKGK